MSKEQPAEAPNYVKQLVSCNTQFAARMIFDDSAFHLAVKSFISPADGKPKEMPPVEPMRLALESARIEAEVKKHSETRDDTLADRWRGLRSFASFLLNGPSQKLQEAIDAFDATGPNGKWPKPGDASAVANKVFERREDRRSLEFFKDEFWSSGTFLVFDLLRSIYLPQEDSVELERTPILVVNDLVNQNSANTLWLTIARRQGGGGLVMPNWWSLGLIAMKGNGDEHFRSAVEKAINVARPDNRYRHYWWLSHHSGIRPEAISGRSAEASTACCLLALNERSKDNPWPLLDETAAVSALLGPEKLAEPAEIELEGVDKESFEFKLDAAAKSGLIGMTFCKGQWPEDKTVHEFFAEVKGQKEMHRVYLLGVSTLADAYDSLLITSKAIRAYKQEIVWDWEGGVDEHGKPLPDKKDPSKVRGKWKEEETHEDFKNGSGNNS